MEEAFRNALPARRPLRVLEVGGGAGGGFRRWMKLLDRVDRLDFTATDRDERLLVAYREEVASSPDRGPDPMRFRKAVVPGGFAGETFEVLLARSFWDLLPPGDALDFARRILPPGGVFYAALTFAGETRFHPPREEDRRILAGYHRSIADPRAGQRLVEDIRAPGSGFAEIASGRSDWRVVPERGGYPADEEFFLATILGYVQKELGDEATDWLAVRRRQLREARLSFTARQYDVAARREHQSPSEVTNRYSEISVPPCR